MWRSGDMEIYPDLPNGLTFVNGIISGTATVNSTRTTYTVWANNTGGSASAMINLTVVEPVVQLSIKLRTNLSARYSDESTDAAIKWRGG